MLVRSLMVALTIPMLWFLSNLSGYTALWGAITIVAACIPLAAVPTLGIVTKQGSAYMSTFDATRPLNTAWLAGSKIGVATVSMVAGMLVIATSFWFSAPLVDGFIVGVDLTKQNILHYFQEMPVVELALSTFVALVQFTTMVAFMATLHTTYALYLDRITFGVLVVVVYLSVLAILVSTKVLSVSFGIGHVWLGTGLIAAGAIYFIRSLLSNRILSVGQTSALVFGWVLYALAYFYRLGLLPGFPLGSLPAEDGSLDADVPVEFFVFRMGVCLLSLTIFAMAPWSLAMMRHR